VTLIHYHVVWIPVRRRKALVGAVAERLHALLTDAVVPLACAILALEVLPDHVHLFVTAPPTLAPDQIMFWVKGYTARVLRQEFPALRKMPSLWTRAYFRAAAGTVSSDDDQTLYRGTNGARQRAMDADSSHP